MRQRGRLNERIMHFMTRLRNHPVSGWLTAGAIWLASLVSYLLTLAPGIAPLDSAEFTTGAYTLGIVHAPGYPLYMVLLHLFEKLPIRDVAYRANLFSALCLSGTVWLVYHLLVELTESRGVAGSLALVFGWSRYVWPSALVAEIYALQLFSLALLTVQTMRLYRREIVERRAVLLTGVALGLALAVTPLSVLVAPGVVWGMWARSPRHRDVAVALLVGGLLAVLPLIYLPLRYQAGPALNMAGHIDAGGTFHAVPLDTFSGLLWMVSGRQFAHLFPAAIRPSLTHIWRSLRLLTENMLGWGLVGGIAGLPLLARLRRGTLVTFLLMFVPYVYFLTVYGAADKHTMFGPVLLLWMLPLSVGLLALGAHLPTHWQRPLWIVLPLLMLIVNLPQTDQHDATGTAAVARQMMAQAPPDAVVLAQWRDVTPLQYMQLVQGERQDIRLVNVFLFEDYTSMVTYTDRVIESGQPLVVVGRGLVQRLPAYTYTRLPLTLPPGQDAPFDVFVVE